MPDDQAVVRDLDTWTLRGCCMCSTGKPLQIIERGIAVAYVCASQTCITKGMTWVNDHHADYGGQA